MASFVIGIGGGTGAGKTTVAEAISNRIGEEVTILPLDNYYRDRSHLPVEDREAVNYDHPDAFDWSLFEQQLAALQDGETINMPQYDFSTHERREEQVTVEPTPVIVVEGILALYEEDVRTHTDLNVYVETDADVRILRRIRRDVVDRGRDLEGVMDQYLNTVKPMHERFVEPSKKHADIIIPEGHNPRALDLLIDSVRSEIED